MKKRLARLLRNPENKICADCPEPKPNCIAFIKPQQAFALGSKLLASFVCPECADLHRNLGVHICYVKSIIHDDLDKEEIDRVGFSGNEVVNEIFEGHLQKATTVEMSIKPLLGSDIVKKERFIRQKYVDLYFYRKKSHYKHIAEVNEMIAESKKILTREEEEEKKQKKKGKKTRKKLRDFLKSDDGDDTFKDAKTTSGCSTTVDNTVSTPHSCGDSSNWLSGSINYDGSDIIEPVDMYRLTHNEIDDDFNREPQMQAPKVKGERKGKRPSRGRSETKYTEHASGSSQFDTQQQPQHESRSTPKTARSKSRGKSSSSQRGTRRDDNDNERSRSGRSSSKGRSSAIREQGQKNSNLRRSRSRSNGRYADPMARTAARGMREDAAMNSSTSNDSGELSGVVLLFDEEPCTSHSRVFGGNRETSGNRSREQRRCNSGMSGLTVDTLDSHSRERIDSSRIRSRSEDRGSSRRRSNQDPLATTIRDETMDKSIRSRNLDHIVTPVRDHSARSRKSMSSMMDSGMQISPLPLEQPNDSSKSSRSGRRAEKSNRSERSSQTKSRSPMAPSSSERSRRHSRGHIANELNIELSPHSKGRRLNVWPSVADERDQKEPILVPLKGLNDSVESNLSGEGDFKVIDPKLSASHSSGISWDSYGSFSTKYSCSTGDDTGTRSRRQRRGSRDNMEVRKKQRETRKSEIFASLNRESSEDNPISVLPSNIRRTKSDDAPIVCPTSKRNMLVRSKSEEKAHKIKLRPSERASLRPSERTEQAKASRKKNMSLRKEWEKMKRENEQNFVAFEKSFPTFLTRVE